MIYRITLDVGTTAVKTGLFTESLALAAFHIEEYALATPAPGIVELDPEVYWRAAVKGVRHVIASAAIDPRLVKSITCSTQGETLIPVDSNRRHLHNAIVWLDGRAAEEAKRIAAAFPPEKFYPVTGQPEVLPLTPVAKIVWLMKHHPDIFSKTHKLLLLEDYLVMRLSGEFVSNPAVMCSTGYLDIRTDALWSEMLDFCGVDRRKIPDILPCGVVVGNIRGEAADELGLPRSVKITTGAMDQVASAVGSGNIREGVVAEITGTVLGVTATADSFSGARVSPVNVYKHALPDKYLLFGFSQTAGMILKWFKDEFCRDLAGGYEEMTALAAAVDPLAGGLLAFPHFTGMQIPENNPAAKGVFFGIGLNTGRPHFIRAILESIAYMLRENIEAMRDDFGLQSDEIYSLGGGAKSSLWLQIKADITGLPLVRLAEDESTSLGAALLGALATRDFSGMEEATSLIKRNDRHEPDQTVSAIYERGYRDYRKLYPQLKPLFRRI